MKISELQEIIKESKQRFDEFMNTINDEDSKTFYKNSKLVIQFIHPEMLQVEISASLSVIETWFKLRDVIVKNDTGNEFINLCDKYFIGKSRNIKVEKIIKDLFSKIEISDFNIELGYPTLDIDKIQALKFYLHEQGIMQIGISFLIQSGRVSCQPPGYTTKGLKNNPTSSSIFLSSSFLVILGQL